MIGAQVITLVALVTACLVAKGAAIQCSICDTNEDGWECISKPPASKPCTGYDYCINVAKYSLSGKLSTFTRSCSPFALPSACLPGMDKKMGTPVQLCYSTCDSDGCNADRSLHHILDLLRRKRK